MKYKMFLLAIVAIVFFVAGCGQIQPVGGGTLTPQTPPPSDGEPRPGVGVDWRDQIIYFVMVDRFVDGNPANNATVANDPARDRQWRGGDLQGIQNNIAYIRALGATALWITPIVMNVWECDGFAGYHGYWAQDFTRIDPHFAPSIAFYSNFVATLQSSGILVIQDIVANHMGNLLLYRVGGSNVWEPPFSIGGYTRIWIQDTFPGQPWVTAGNRLRPSTAPFNQISAFHNYGRIHNWDAHPETILGDFFGLDGLRTESPTVRDALIAVYRDWITWTGIDGFRMDTVKHVDEVFFDHFVPHIRKHVLSLTNKNFFQFGEAWLGSHSAMARYAQGNRFDSMLNFQFYYASRSVFAHGGATTALTAEINDRRTHLRATPINDGAQGNARDLAVNFIDNHDVNRFMTDAGGNTNRLHAALSYLMTAWGIPCIYYNTEWAVSGGSTTGRAMLVSLNPAGNPTFSLISNLSVLRQTHLALRRGEAFVLRDSGSAGIFAFVRHIPGNHAENVFVMINSSTSAISGMAINLSTYAANGQILTNIYHSSGALTGNLTVSGGQVTVNVPAHGMVVYRRL